MRNRIAFRAHASQAAGWLVLGALAFGGLITEAGRSLLASSKAGPQDAPRERHRDPWLTVSLSEYQRWRELLEKDPPQAGARVARAFHSVAEDRQPRALADVHRAQGADSAIAQRSLRDRGLLVWRTLETVIDRARVDRALSLFTERFAASPALIEDFQKICEEVSGRDLHWFFQYYLRGTERPEITLRRIPGNAPNEVAGEIVVRNAPREFQVRVEMRLYTNGGTVHHSVATNGAVTPFTITTNQLVTRIVLDPDLRILRRLP